MAFAASRPLRLRVASLLLRERVDLPELESIEMDENALAFVESSFTSFSMRSGSVREE